MTRLLTGHQVNPANDKLQIEVLDEPGSGGAHHLYQITGFNTATNPSLPDQDEVGAWQAQDILFQNGPIAERGVNGVTHEALLAILIDRLECFQRGPYACAENAQTLTFLESAQECLLNRTRACMARGVEGTHTV
jgi:hypothetical protein